MATEEEIIPEYDDNAGEEAVEADSKEGQDRKVGTYVNLHTAGFKDFLLKDEIMKSIQECGFEHPSEVQHEVIPLALFGHDILCQAKSGMGKTAVFVLTILQQLDAQKNAGAPQVVVLCHARELAFQICKEFERFSKYMAGVTAKAFFGGVNVNEDVKVLKEKKPIIIVGTPGRVKDLCNRGFLDLKSVAFFVVDECDKTMGAMDMRSDVQNIFMHCPKKKQVMMFSATLPGEMRSLCRKYMQDDTHTHEIFVDDESKLTLHGLLQYYVRLQEKDKIAKLLYLLDKLEFNQVVVFCSTGERVEALQKILTHHQFPTTSMHGHMPQTERLKHYSEFREFKSRILVATDLVGRGIDIERVNIVFNFDVPADSDSYLHRVGRAGRFGTKGLAVTFVVPGQKSSSVGASGRGVSVTSNEDEEVLKQIQSRFSVQVNEFPDEDIAKETYMNA